MKISKIRIKNYRSIRNEISIDYFKRLVIVGPNNSGKTNILEAINLFFSPDPEELYSIEDDIPFESMGEQTSIIIQFCQFSHKSHPLLEEYGQLLNFLQGGPPLSDEVTIYLMFSSLGKATYRFHTNYKIKPEYREEYRLQHDELIQKFRNYFTCKYIPSEKSASSIYENLLLPHLKDHVGTLLQDQEEKVTSSLKNVSQVIESNLYKSGLDYISCEFKLPKDQFSEALSKFDFFINDGKKTLSFRKGTGIQASITLAFFKWITQQENKKNKEVIWLIEEPESYLHPGLYDSCSKIIEDLAENSTVLITTHSIGFVPQNPKNTISTSNTEQTTICSSFETYAQATASIRRALGLRFSDFYNLSKYNIFVEGKTDKLILEWALRLIKPKGAKNNF